MNWNEVLADPCLQDLPYKIELNEYGEIVMSPASNWHSRRQMKIATLLEKYLKDGESFPECSVETTKGVKVADVAWLSAAFLKAFGYETPYRVAPEICVEVLSPSNSERQMREKIDLYLAKGAKEVWTCDDGGKMKFYDHAGEMKKSKRAAKFPNKV